MRGDSPLPGFGEFPISPCAFGEIPVGPRKGVTDALRFGDLPTIPALGDIPIGV